MIQTKQKVNDSRAKIFGNLKVLLAEDHGVNQLLTQSFLQYWGVEIKIAVPGFEVLNLLAKEDFDVVLMDIQMPEKRGFEAASEIRNLPDLKKKNVPIIALAANTLKGEEQKYRSAGMDDFLAKPFNEEDLYEVINRVLRKEGLFNQPNNNEDLDLQEQQHEQPLIKEKLYDLKQVEEIALGNTEFILSLVNIFMVTIPLACSEMVEASKVDQWDKVSSLAHKLKSTIDTLDIACIRTDIRTIELDAKKEINLGSIKKLIFKVNKVIQATAEQLKYEFSL